MSYELSFRHFELACLPGGDHLAAGLRTAFVLAPTERAAQRLAGALRATTVMTSPITTALSTRWIVDGTAMAMLDAVRAESVARQALAARRLGKYGFLAHPEGFHLWLPLASSWSVVEFASWLRTKGAGVVASAAFSTDGGSAGHGARLPGRPDLA